MKASSSSLASHVSFSSCWVISASYFRIHPMTWICSKFYHRFFLAPISYQPTFLSKGNCHPREKTICSPYLRTRTSLHHDDQCMQGLRYCHFRALPVYGVFLTSREISCQVLLLKIKHEFILWFIFAGEWGYFSCDSLLHFRIFSYFSLANPDLASLDRQIRLVWGYICCELRFRSSLGSCDFVFERAGITWVIIPYFLEITHNK